MNKAGKMAGRDLDRRRFGRRTLHLPCAYRLEGKDYPGRIIDLSFQGAFVEASGVCPTAGTPIKILLERKAETITLEARVRHQGWFLLEDRNVDGFGVELRQITPQVLGTLHRLMRSSKKSTRLGKRTLTMFGHW